MVIAWLYNIIDKNLHGSVAYAETARQIWLDLEERYSQSNALRVHQIKREITMTSQGNQTIVDYFTKLKPYGMNWRTIKQFELAPMAVQRT